MPTDPAVPHPSRPAARPSSDAAPGSDAVTPAGGKAADDGGAAGREAGRASSDVPPYGVGPWQGPWPEDPRYDPVLLATGDRRNVEDRYRYWTLEAVRRDLAARAHPLEVAIENWEHDFNIGSIVRTANAFGARRVHIVGRHRWNRRGAMVTDRYLDVVHHATVGEFRDRVEADGVPIVGIDNVPGSVPLEGAALPSPCVLVFGSEGPGLSAEMQAACGVVYEITQYGSTRSINAGAAAAIAMWAWTVQHRPAGGRVAG
jgi:tRNA(Leu) C34 or U34 (ribose-2'-O)-methylase TrmL